LEPVPRKQRLILLLGITPIFIALFVYSATWAFIWDEGFHLIAARLIADGKRPYLDFCFPQTPLNAYINAGLLMLFGNGWRAIHLAAAGYMSLGVWLAADFVQSRLPSGRWRTPCALAAAVLFGLNLVVVQFGPAAQAYGISMMLGPAAFRAALPSVSSRKPWFALLAGICAGAAAASTLLSATIPMVLLVWIFFWNRAGSRLWKSIAYLAGCALPFLPVVWLFLKGPKQTLFNVLQYQTLLRRTNWGDANEHDMDVLSGWLTAPQALFLLALFAAAIIFLYRERLKDWPVAWKEFALAAAMSIAGVLFISTAHPTFGRYYVVAMPFIGICAALGLYAAGSRLTSQRHAWLTCGTVIALGGCMFLRELYDEKDDDHWAKYEDVARAVSEVTPMGVRFYADELTYFLMDRTPPEGMEFSYSQKLELPPDQEKLYHVISNKELIQQIKAGQFVTFETCRDGIMDDLAPAADYKQHSQPGDCDLFWEPKGSAAKR
jgi:hypothetical protein